MKTILYKWTAMLTALLLLVTAVLAGTPVAAAEYDSQTRTAISTLAAFDIVDGTVDETAPVTRAEFARLLVALTDREDEVAAAEQRTLFADVTSARADAGYINLAYTAGYLSGWGNGYFTPDGYIAYEAAVTACLRVLGYSESEIGANYPDDALRLGKKLGLTEQLDRLVGEALNWGEVARLLYATVCAETAKGAVYAEQMAAKTVRDVVLLSADCVSPDGILKAAKLYSSGTAVWYARAAELDETMVGYAGTALLDADGRIITFLPDDTCYTVVDGILLANAVRKNGKYTVELYTETGRTSYPRANTISANLVGATGTLLLRENGYATAFVSDEDAIYDLVKDVTLLSTSVTSDTGIPNCVEVYASGKTAYYPLADGVSLSGLRGSEGTLLCDENGDVIDFLPDEVNTTVENGIFLESGSSGATFIQNGKTVTYPAATTIASSQAGYSGRILRNKAGYVTAFIADTSERRSVIEDAVLLAVSTTSTSGESNCAAFYVSGKTAYYKNSYSTALRDSMVGYSGTLIVDEDNYLITYLPGDTSYEIFTATYVSSASGKATFLCGSTRVSYPVASSLSAQSGAQGRVLLNHAGYVVAFLSDSSERSSIIEDAILLSTYSATTSGYGAKFYVNGKTTVYPYVTSSISSSYYPWYSTEYSNGYYIGYYPWYNYSYTNSTLSGQVGSSGTLVLDADGCIEEFIPNGTYYTLVSGVVVASGASGYYGSVISLYNGGSTMQYTVSGSISAQTGASGTLLVDPYGRAYAFISESSGSYSMSQSGIVLSVGNVAADGQTTLIEFYTGGRTTTYAISGSLSGAIAGSYGKLMLDSSGRAVGFIAESANSRSTTVTTATATTLETASGSYSIDASQTVIAGGSVSTWNAVAPTLTAGTAITLHFNNLGGIDLIVVG